MSCKSRAVDALNSGQIDVAGYERMVAECDGITIPTATDVAPKVVSEGDPTETPTATATVSASLPMDKGVENDNTFTHATLIIISVVTLIIVAKKYWDSSSPIIKAGIVVVGGIIAHDAMHHFFKRGFVYSVRTKLNV